MIMAINKNVSFNTREVKTFPEEKVLINLYYYLQVLKEQKKMLSTKISSN